MKVTVKHENDNQREFGYGLYINAYVADDLTPIPALYASECLPRDATADQIKAAEKRVRTEAQRKFKAERARI